MSITSVVFPCMVALLAVCGTTTASEPRWLPDRFHHLEVSDADGTLQLQTTGIDPFLVCKLDQSFDRKQRVLEFEYFSTQQIEPVSVFPGPPFTEATRIDLPRLSIAEGWQTCAVDLVALSEKPIPVNTTLLRIDLGTKPNVRLQIRNLRLRELTQQEVNRAKQAESVRLEKIARSKRMSKYLRASFPHQFSEVTIGQQFVTLTIDAKAPDLDSVELVEFPGWLPVDAKGIGCKPNVENSDGRIRMQLPRFDGNRDRLQSAWRLRQPDSDSFLTARTYPTAFEVEADHAASPMTPKSQKGLSGISARGPLEELPELGIHGVTINLVLNRFLSGQAGPGKERVDVSGPPIYFDTRAFAGYDGLTSFAHRNQIVVSAIVLISRSKHQHQSPLVHPESDGGVYAMPDLTRERGMNIYGEVLRRIANRYRNTDSPRGGISNWIIHNEIDFHPVWTNMGPQPREILTDTYYRSMRIVHNAARLYNPHARVFASLTHNWHVTDPNPWKQLSPRQVIQTLQRYSTMEGDFAWGIAYHPYPQSLFASVAWNDTKITNDFDTPLITIQNLQVLGRFLEQPNMRASSGEVRPVLLSEQGFHSDSYAEDAQARHAGSLLYAMNRVRGFPWVESFHYHRWIDHPQEGGLLLGLRTLPTKEHPNGERKRAWYLYQAIDSDREQNVSEGLPSPQ
ncbi:MAG: DUF5722 domain-containing protein [Rubripirellula sp.]